jgi:hypothetical protein
LWISLLLFDSDIVFTLPHTREYSALSIEEKALDKTRLDKFSEWSTMHDIHELFRIYYGTRE